MKLFFRPNVPVGLLLLSAATAANAQAWLMPAGEGVASVTYHNVEAKGHFTRTGDRLDLGGSQSQALQILLDYSLTDHVALTLSIPYLWARNGADPSPVLGHSGIDDGRYHSTWQDWTVGVRRSFLEGPLAASGSIDFVIPSHNYDVRGEAAPGRGLHEMIAAIQAERQFESQLYLQAQYGHAFVENDLDISTDRDNLDLEIGLPVSERINVRAFAGWQETRGGLTDAVFSQPDSTEFLEHDRLLDADHVKIGVGASTSLSESIGLHVSYVRTVAGENTHFGSGFAIGASWRFSSNP